nr:hypothetical protein [Methanosarcina siciliae]
MNETPFRDFESIYAEVRNIIEHTRDNVSTNSAIQIIKTIQRLSGMRCRKSFRIMKKGKNG